MEKNRKKKPARRIPEKTFKFAVMIGEQNEAKLRKVIK